MTRRRDHTPARDRSLSPVGSEALDTPTLEPALARRTLEDITLANRFLGGCSAVRYGVGRLLGPGAPRGALAVLDVGAGAGDVLENLRRMLGRSGTAVTGVAVDFLPEATRMAHERCELSVRGDAFSLPFADRSVDIVVASQLLHHFARPATTSLLRELDRVARLGVVIADLRRGRAGEWGLRLAALALGFHPISRADGVTSLRRGFTPAELRTLCRLAGLPAAVRRRPGFRLVAYWRKLHAHP